VSAAAPTSSVAIPDLINDTGERTNPRPASPERDDHGSAMVPRDALVVDDDTDGRDALSDVLATQGYTVRQAENGRIALEMIAERVPGFLVLDLEMPVMNGWEVLASLQRAGALDVITVVVVSAGASPPPDVSFLRKPCVIGELLAMLSAAPSFKGIRPFVVGGAALMLRPAPRDLEGK
jgi:CheY-like chemotaxis protein